MAENEPERNRQYSDEQFLEYIPEGEGEYIGAYRIARAIGCTLPTVNRRVALMADEKEIDIIDLESAELVSPETAQGSGRPMFGFGKALADVLNAAETD